MQKRYISVAAGLLVAALLSAGVYAAPLATPQQGIDVSHYDEAVDFAAVKDSGRTFAFIKSGDGYQTQNSTGGLADAWYLRNSQNATANDVLWGPYYFFRPYNVSSSTYQAEQFWKQIRGTGYTLKPVIDIEVYRDSSGTQTSAEVRACLTAFIQRFNELSGSNELTIYSGSSYLKENAIAQHFDYPIWQADYRGYVENIGKSASVWQYSESGKNISGVTAPNVDLNVMYDDNVLMPGTSLQAVSVPGTVGTAPAAQTGSPVIRAHQASWNSLRIYPSIAEDGLDGPETRTATKSLQWLTGITQDSVWGAQTQAAYQSIVSRPTLRQGSTGQAARYIQIRVGASIDGRFGPATDAAVRAWQRAHGLAADGIVGADTWAALLGG